MPGLLRMVGRTAVIAGTATTVSNRVSRRQATRWSQDSGAQQEQYAEPPPQAPPAPAPGAGESRIEKLKELGDLKAQGVLSEEEFAAEKARILGS